MSFIQSESFAKLRCINCKKYLSHFPIYVNLQGASFCGRCPKPTEENNIQNKIYETLAQTQKFPCCYDINGCTESLTPANMPLHEEFCSYRKYMCPIASFTDCQWQGFVKDLLDHFEHKHPTFLLKDAQFELDFINSHKENYLLPFCEDLFVVNRTNDSKTNTFSCTVWYIGNNAQAKNFVYKIMLENGNKSQSYKITNKLNTTTDINSEIIRNILNDPTSIVARIEILEHNDDVENQIVAEKEEEYVDNNLNYDLLRGLECVVCMEYMVPPIHQCITGHSICFNCKANVTECPTCRKEFQNTQNFALAQVISHLTYPCKYSKCRFTAKARDIRQHEVFCVFGPLKCPLHEHLQCDEEIILSEMWNHIVKNHNENVLDMDTVNIPFNLDNDEKNMDYDCYILRYCFKLFKLHYMYKNQTFYWAMQLIGPADDSLKYKFEIDVIDNSGNNHRAYFRTSCTNLSDSASAFDAGKCMYLKFDQVKSMISTEFSYRIRILQ